MCIAVRRTWKSHVIISIYDVDGFRSLRLHIQPHNTYVLGYVWTPRLIRT